MWGRIHSPWALSCAQLKPLTVALNASKNAGILAAEILGIADKHLSKKLADLKKEMKEEVEKKAENLPK